VFVITDRATRKSDLVMPDQARAVARELGVCYYETSVFTYYGVNEVFENSIRAALIARRQQRFWMTNLKRVQRPLLQVTDNFTIEISFQRKKGLSLILIIVDIASIIEIKILIMLLKKEDTPLFD